jgi:hypothetical protein
VAWNGRDRLILGFHFLIAAHGAAERRAERQSKKAALRGRLAPEFLSGSLT